jgi:DNA-directed RNA polymerase specialized sigma24 family protein
MSADYYVFAFYEFLLICVILLLCRALFSRAKKQKAKLEEKEAKLLKLYQTVEDAMDELYDLASESKSEIEEALNKLSSLMGSLAKAEIGGPGTPSLKADASETEFQKDRRDGVKQTDGDRERFREPIKPDKEQTRPTSAADQAERRYATRAEIILERSRSGKTSAQIAKELGITLNEVDLVIGMNKNSL